MLVNVHHDNPAEHRRLLVAGVGFIVLCLGLVYLSIAIYNKAFENATTVTLKADRAGLQLPKNGDVRRNGVLVGRVKEISQDGREAEIVLALQPSAAREIPSNVRAEILPTTLFGQKYISLVEPETPADDAIADGDVVSSDRVETNVELNQILTNLFPLLNAIRPADLNSTLYSLSTAMQGRGERIGALLESLEGYAGRLADKLPTLQRDFELLVEVSRTYEGATPELMRSLRNLTVSSRTLVEKQGELSSFFDDVTGLAETSARVLRENETGLIRLGELSRPLLRLLDTYAPEYPCLLEGLDVYTAKLGAIFKGGRVNQVLELGSTQKPAYDADDRPEYAAVGHGPWCAGLPNPSGVVDTPLADGSDLDEYEGGVVPFVPFRTVDPAAFSNPTKGFAGTRPEQRLLNVLVAADTGVSPDDLGSLPTLLYGPQVRGTTVERR